MNDSERKLAESLIQTRKVPPEEMERCIDGKKEGETLVDALVRQGTIQTGELERILEDLPTVDKDLDNTFARAVRKIGRYRVISEIGRGGMGRVYLAYDPNLKRSVALKVMRIEELEDSARYRRETEIAAGLQHSNIAAIYDAQQEGETFIIAMQYIDGESLDKTRLDPREALKAIAETARAVHYAHEHAIIHRDIKPENIMRAREGRIFIMDFGVARRIERKASLTQTGTVIGTPMYMSPEQAAGRILDIRTDVYSLGATLYSLIAGRPPFVGASVLDIIQRIGKAEPPRLQAFHPGLHRDVATIVQKAMRKERVRRYQTALALAEDIERYLSGEPIEARPMSYFEKSRRHLRKRPWMVNALLFLVLAVGVASGLVWREKVRDERISVDQGLEQERERRRDLADDRLNEAIRKLNEWERYLYFEPRDLTPKRPLLTEAVSLCQEANTLADGQLPEANYQRAHALALLGRDEEAEEAVTEAIEAAPKGRFFLERARIRLQRVIQDRVGLTLVHQADFRFFLDGTEPLLKGFGGEYIRRIIDDLKEAERLGINSGFEQQFARVIRFATLGDFAKARETGRAFLESSSPWRQWEIHRILAWLGYLEFSLVNKAPENLLAETEKHVSLAIVQRRSDADLYLFRAQLGASRSAMRMNPRFRGDEAGQGNGKALEDVKTVLRIRPGDPNARILSVQLLAEKIPPADWAAIWHEKGPDRKRVDRAIREVFDPGEKLCASIVADHPGNSDAWIQWTLLKWFRGFLEAKGGEDDDLIEPGLLHQIIETASRGLKVSRNRNRWVLLFLRGIAFLRVFEMEKDPAKKDGARKSARSDFEKILEFAPGMKEDLEFLISGLKIK